MQRQQFCRLAAAANEAAPLLSKKLNTIQVFTTHRVRVLNWIQWFKIYEVYKKIDNTCKVWRRFAFRYMCIIITWLYVKCKWKNLILWSSWTVRIRREYLIEKLQHWRRLRRCADVDIGTGGDSFSQTADEVNRHEQQHRSYVKK